MTTVEYKGFDYQYPFVVYSYEFRGKEYRRGLDLGNLSRVAAETAEPIARDRLLSHVGLTIAREFFRLDQVDRIVARPPHFFEDSGRFFEEWLLGGLAELRHENGIPLDRPVEVVIDNPQTPQPAASGGDRILLCNGGGKDSVVAGEALLSAGADFTWLSLGTSPAMEKVRSISGAPGLHVRSSMGRGDLKAARRFKGHLPFLPIVSSVGALVAHLQGFGHVAVGNEYSANFPNFLEGETPVNHQYSKSFAFETLFRDYLWRNLARISYFSPLQPFYELQIAQAFTRFPRYFEAFKSCNAGLWKDVWCRNCPKCAFTWLALATRLNESELARTFQGDPWEGRRVRETVRDLITGSRRAFSCIGIYDEARVAAQGVLENPDGPARRPDVAAALRTWLSGAEPADAAEILHGHRLHPHHIPAAIWPHIAEFMEQTPRNASSSSLRPDRLLILSASSNRTLFERDMAGRILLQALDRAGMAWDLHRPWEPLPAAAGLSGVLSWSFRHEENNFVFWARKAEAHYRAAGLPILNSIAEFSTRHSFFLRRWRDAGIPCARFERFSDIDEVRLSYPLILRCDGVHKGRNTFLVRSLEEARPTISDQLSEGVQLDLALEFLDLRFPDGYYRNRFAFVAGDRVIPRQHAIGRDWLLNFETAEASAQSVAEDREFRRRGEERSDLVLRAARATGAAIVGLDYGLTPAGEYVFWEGHRHFKMTGDAGYRTGKLESATGRAAVARAADDEELGHAMAEMIRAELFPIAAVA